MYLRDIRYALRGLWHSRGFAVVAILCLGFGIGVNATIFSIMDGVLLKPYPYPDPDHLVNVGLLNKKTGDTTGLSYPDMRDWKAASTAATTIVGVSTRSMAVSDEGREPERYLGAGVSWDLFHELGAVPVYGRDFTESDDRPGGGGVVMLGYDLWTQRYHADPSIVGKTITVDSAPLEVIGVMPPRFAFPNNQKLWTAITPMIEHDPRDARGIFAFARLKPGVTRDRADADFVRVADGIARQFPATNENWTGQTQTLTQVFLPREVQTVIALMMTGVTLVLLIACSNVANLLLARATARKREISVRTALGAGRWRIITQLLTESVVLSLVSLPLAFGLAYAGTKLIAAAVPPDQVPYYIHWDLDWRSMLYTVVVAVATALVFGLFPALQVSRGSLHDSLKEGTRGNSMARSKLRSALVVVQVSLALVALVIALLFVRSFSNLDSYQLGFDPKPLMTMRMYMSGKPYDPPDSKELRVEDVLRRVQALPGVDAAFASNLVPLSGGGGGRAVQIDGQPSDTGAQPTVFAAGVTAQFLKTMGVAVQQGRDFAEADITARDRVAVINAAMVRRFWPTSNALGQRFRISVGGSAPEWFTVIGITPNFKVGGINPGDNQPGAAAFFPYPFDQTLNTGLVIRVAGGSAALITGAVRDAIHQSDAQIPIAAVHTMEEVRQLSFWEFGLYGWIFGTIGVVGLLLASVGVYGVLSYSVSQRTQEIGVRVALGASERQVLGLVLRYGLVLVGTGVLAGLVCAPIASWLARSLLFNVSPFDPITFGGVAALLMLVAFVASYLPALRATRVNPVTALRGE